MKRKGKLNDTLCQMKTWHNILYLSHGNHLISTQANYSPLFVRDWRIEQNAPRSSRVRYCQLDWTTWSIAPSSYTKTKFGVFLLNRLVIPLARASRRTWIQRERVKENSSLHSIIGRLLFSFTFVVMKASYQMMLSSWWRGTSPREQLLRVIGHHTKPALAT